MRARNTQTKMYFVQNFVRLGEQLFRPEFILVHPGTNAPSASWLFIFAKLIDRGGCLFIPFRLPAVRALFRREKWNLLNYPF